ncbi:Asp23/Gls24 family envelope stress response protein [Nakamurella sp.]|uniref:Asp23/Gls24 family envelope stress response protein n=1 Tax=Nakamurella sp. TaxID=1869182 RepID=UPI003784585B
MAGTEVVGTAITADPAVRGRTVLLDRVVEKTAAAAAAEVEHVHAAGRGAVGQLLGTRPAIAVQSAIDGHLAQLSLEVEIDYPAPLRQVTRHLREHVSDRVLELCSITVTDLDVHVVALRQQTRPERRVQ